MSKLKDKVKTFVEDFNAAVNHNQDTDKISVSPKVTVQNLRRVRRTTKDDDTKDGSFQKINNNNNKIFYLEGVKDEEK